MATQQSNRDFSATKFREEPEIIDALTVRESLDIVNFYLAQAGLQSLSRDEISERYPIFGVNRPNWVDRRAQNLTTVGELDACHLFGLQRFEAADHHFAVASGDFWASIDRFDDAPTAQVEFINGKEHRAPDGEVELVNRGGRSQQFGFDFGTLIGRQSQGELRPCCLVSFFE